MRLPTLLALLPALAVAAADLPAGFFPPPPDAPAKGEGRCRTCEGRGTVESAFSDTSIGEFGDTVRPPCPTCKGRGRCIRPLTVAERERLQRQTLNTYEREQRAARRTPIGAGFMDLDAAKALTPEAHAALAARFPKRCKTCLGLGLDTCRKCKGRGKVERRERVEGEDGETRTKTTDVPCAECGASGAVPCRRCDGSGLAKVCTRCDGLGTTEVEAKRDSPAHTELCRSCKGDGRR